MSVDSIYTVNMIPPPNIGPICIGRTRELRNRVVLHMDTLAARLPSYDTI
jgi:hypothetical protein